MNQAEDARRYKFFGTELRICFWLLAMLFLLVAVFGFKSSVWLSMFFLLLLILTVLFIRWDSAYHLIILTPEKLEYLRKSLPSYTIISDNGHDLSILSKHPVISYKIVDLPTFVASLSSSNDIEKIIADADEEFPNINFFDRIWEIAIVGGQKRYHWYGWVFYEKPGVISAKGGKPSGNEHFDDLKKAIKHAKENIKSLTPDTCVYITKYNDEDRMISETKTNWQSVMKKFNSGLSFRV